MNCSRSFFESFVNGVAFGEEQESSRCLFDVGEEGGESVDDLSLVSVVVGPVVTFPCSGSFGGEIIVSVGWPCCPPYFSSFSFDRRVGGMTVNNMKELECY